MGDISEIRGLLVVIGFLAMVVLIITQIPSGFLYTSGELRSVDYSGDQWQGIDLQSFAETWNSTSINSISEQFDIGGRNMEFDAEYALDYMLLSHRYGIGLLFTERGDWYNRDGIKVSSGSIYGEMINAEDLDTDYNASSDIQFRVEFDAEAKFQVWAYFDFNETTYALPSDAWDNDDLGVLVGIGFDQINTSFTAWDLVGMILFFQLPDLGLSILGVIISIPLWVSIAYLAYVLIIKVIPLIAGG